MLLSGGLAIVLHPDRQIFPDRRCLYLKPGGPEVQCNHALEMPLTRLPEHRMMPLCSVQTYAYPQYQTKLPVPPIMWGCLAALLGTLTMSLDHPQRALSSSLLLLSWDLLCCWCCRNSLSFSVGVHLGTKDIHPIGHPDSSFDCHLSHDS